MRCRLRRQPSSSRTSPDGNSIPRWLKPFEPGPLASSPFSSSSARRKPLRAISLPRSRGRAGWGLTWSWRRPHEPRALVCKTRCRGLAPSPTFVDGEPARFGRAVGCLVGDERPHPWPGRLQRRRVDVAGAPLAADPRRGESRRGKSINGNSRTIVNPDGLTRYRAQADPDADPGFDAHGSPDSNGDPDADADANSNPDANAHPDADTDADADADAHSNPHADADVHADADAHSNTHADADV